MIIGVVGSLRAGKDELANYLESRGFIHLSLSRALREMLVAKGHFPDLETAYLPSSRKFLQEWGDNQRKEVGYGFLMHIALELMEPGKSYVLTSIRNPGELETLKKKVPDAKIVAVDASLPLRYSRELNIRRESGDPLITMDQFVAMENIEKSDKPHEMQHHTLMELADVTVSNDHTSLEEFHKVLDSELNGFIENHEFPLAREA